MNHVRNHLRGFTLIEILIVVVILGILAAIVIPQVTEASDDAGASSARATLHTTRVAIEMFKFKESADPTNFNELVTAGYLHQPPGPVEGYTYNFNAGPPVTVTVNDPDGNLLTW